MNKNLQLISSIILTIGAVIFLFALGEILFFKQGVNLFSNFLQDHFNINKFFIFAIAIVLLAISIIYVVPAFKSYLNPLVKREKKNQSIVIMAAFAFSILMALGFANNGANFSAKGEAMTCYTIFEGKKYSANCNRKVHKDFGTPIYKTTTESLGEENFRKISVDENTRFFNPSTKKALIYYGTGINGEVEFFNRAGFHPQTNEKLKPVTKAIINDYFKPKPVVKSQTKPVENQSTYKNNKNSNPTSSTPKVERPYLNLNSSIKNRSNQSQLAIVLLNNGQLDDELANKLKNQMMPNAVVYTNLVSANQLTTTHFSRLQSGDFATLNINNYVDYVAVGTSNYQFQQSKSSSRTMTCKLTVQATIFTSNGTVANNFKKSGTGIGFNQNEAKQKAIANLN